MRLGPLTLGTLSVGSHVIWLASGWGPIFWSSLLYGLASRFTITILYYNCISSLFARVFFGSLLFRIPSVWVRCSFSSLLIWVVFFWARLYFGAHIFTFGTVLALYFFLFRLCLYSLLHECFWIVAILFWHRFQTDLKPIRVSRKPVA